MTSIDKSLHLAYKTARSTSWEAEPIYDYSGQRYHKDSIRSQLNEYIISSRNHVILMFSEWALTGKWSLFQKQPVYFVREVLIWAIEQNHDGHYPDFPDTPPPWKSKHVIRFLDATIYGWLKEDAKQWLTDRTDEFYELQEDMFDDYNPHI